VEEGVAILQSLLSDPTQVVEVAKDQRESVLASWTYDALASKWTALFEATMNRTMSDCVFTNDGGVQVKLIKHRFSDVFRRRDNHEVLFRKISSYLIKQGIVKGNIVDLGAWIGDNSIPWALLSDRCIYAIDPSPDNCSYIKDMAALNDIKNIIIIQKAISDKSEVLSTNDNINHCSFVYNNPGVVGTHKLESTSLDQLYRDQVIQDVGYIHLDVEGMEAKVVAGATELIQSCRPIIAFEQHLDLDDYRGLSRFLISKGYTVFLNNEVLPGCRHDCRNLFAFPSESMTHDFIDSIHAAIGVNSLVLIT
jgi:FkbM family methyltransferase